MSNYRIVGVQPLAPGIATTSGLPVVALLSLAYAANPDELFVCAGVLRPDGTVIPIEGEPNTIDWTEPWAPSWRGV